MRKLCLLGCIAVGSAGCLNAVAKLVDGGPNDAGTTDAAPGPSQCADAGGTCVLSPAPANCLAISLDLDCGTDDRFGAACCITSDAGPTRDAGTLPDSGSSPDGGQLVDGGACLAGPGLDGGVTYVPETDASSYLSAASGDLNGDGLFDLLAGWQGNGIGGFDLFFGLPDGGLATPITYSGGNGWVEAIGDMDGDGFPDVIVSTLAESSGFAIFFNDGRGGLAPPVAYPAALDVWGIGIGDFNGDNIPDLVLAENGGAELVLGLGSRTFAAGIPLPGQTSFVGGGLVVADLDLDGLPDIAMNALDAGSFVVLLSQGDGGFETTIYPVQTYGQVAILPNAQAAPDLVLAEGPGIQILKNTGHGTFTVGEYLGALGRFLAVADFNGDCIPDVASSVFDACTAQELGLNLLYGDGDGGLGAPETLLTAGLAPGGLASMGPVTAPRALGVANSCGPGIAVYGDASKH